MVNGINHLLGNYGHTIDLNKHLNICQGTDQDMQRLVSEMNTGSVAGLLMYNVNPAYDYPDAESFKNGLKKVGLTVSMNERLDETASLATYYCPDNHYLESWNDAEPITGKFSTAQPAIAKIFNTRQFQESLLKWMGHEPDFQAYMEQHWENRIFPEQSQHQSFRSLWNKSIHDGVLELPVYQSEQPDYISAALKVSNENKNELELILYEKASIGNGKHANNPWLMEMPDPITMATWDNYACISPAFAEEKGLESEDVVSINGDIELPVLVQPGQPYGTIAIALGYGHSHAGKVANGIGQNVFPLIQWRNGHRVLSGATVEMNAVSGKTHKLARTQSHHTMENRPLVREATLKEFLQKPDSGNESAATIEAQELTLYDIPEFDGYHWGMAINLNACTGCSNCVISCQAENNVAVIGKQEVINRRIMHWIRKDRYYSEEADNPDVVHQPVMCQHCDNAPCENVCPVAATPHNNEGLNQMAYNRCIGTRYCMNNCPYKVRRFNWYEYTDNEKFDYNFNSEQEKLVLNPDVTVRSRGVVEKCSLCVQRIQEKKLQAKMEGRPVRDGEIKTACQQSCPGDAIVFGDMNNPDTEISRINKNPRTYKLLGQLHTLPSVKYMTKIRNRTKPAKGHDDHHEHA